jgi:type I restriction enzyme S subunit
MSKVGVDDWYPIKLDVLPNSWTSCLVGEAICDIQPGFASGVHNKDGVGIPHLRPMNVSRGGETDLSETKSVAAGVSTLRVVEGDVLFNNTNSPELIGKTAAISSGANGAAFSNHMTRLRLPPDLNPRFVARQLHFLWMSGYFRHRCTNHVNQASISSSTLAQTVPLVVAPSEEQDRISCEIEKQFSRLDAATAALKRVQANLKRYRASVLKAACEGRLVPTEAELARKEGRDYEPADKLLQRILRERHSRWEADTLAKMQASGKPSKDYNWKQNYKEPAAPNTTDLPTLPEGWCWARAEQLCGFITKGTTPSANKLFDAPGDIPFIKVYNLTFTGRLDFDTNPTYIGRQTHEQELARSRVIPGDVLMNIVGPPLGKVSVVPDLHKEWNVNQAIAIFRTIGGIENGYLAGLLMTEQILHWATQRAKATAGQFNLTLEICRDLPIPLPPIAEQKRIVAELDRQITYLEKTGLLVDSSSARAQNARQSILSSAFTGQLVSQHPTDEPASALLDRIRAERGAPVMQNPARGSRKEPAHA